MTGPTGAEVRGTAADAARQARGVLAALGDPDDGLTATAAMRNRIEGGRGRGNFPASPGAPRMFAAIWVTGVANYTRKRHNEDEPRVEDLKGQYAPTVSKGCVVGNIRRG